MKEFSTKWKKSKKPRKQRKYRHRAPLHIKQKFIHAHLSKELRKKYNKRSISVRKGDKVTIARGKFKKKTGKVNRVEIKHTKIYLDGIEMTKKDGSKTFYPIEPSNVIITELNLDDKKRMKKLKPKKEMKKEEAKGEK